MRVRTDSPGRLRRIGLALVFGLICGGLGATKSQAAPGAQDGSAAPGSSAKGKAEVELAKGATLTAWGKVGGRKWSVCAERVLEAERALPGLQDSAHSLGEDHAWARRARACPQAVAVLEMAARKELLRRFVLPDALDAKTDLKELRGRILASRKLALTWLDGAENERGRQGDAPPHAIDYWRARAYLSLNRVTDARAALERARGRGQITRDRIGRLDALISLYAGDLDRAVRVAHLAWLDSGERERAAASYVFALVLDRAGDDEGARRMLLAASGSRGSPSQPFARLETMLPLHERLYLLGLQRTSAGRDEDRLAVRIFEAYLALEEPLEPERRLAERHIKRAKLQPGRLGG